MIIRRTFIFFILTFVMSSCGGQNSPATPLQTFQTYVKALKQKDTTTMKLLLSSGTIKILEQEAKSQGVTLDDVVKRDTLFPETVKTIEFRNERIDGQNATIEVKNQFGQWETWPLVLEDEQWKIDKKGYADRLMQDIEQRQNDAFDKLTNTEQSPIQ